MSRRAVVWGVVLAALAGCSAQDTDRLSRVGRKVAEKGHTLSLQGFGPLRQTWPALRVAADPAGGAVELRVRARLQTDVALEGVAIEVSTVGGRVQLEGTVATLTQRRRAVDLAQSTVGVTELVIDKMVEDAGAGR